MKRPVGPALHWQSFKVFLAAWLLSAEMIAAVFFLPFSKIGLHEFASERKTRFLEGQGREKKLLRVSLQRMQLPKAAADLIFGPI